MSTPASVDKARSESAALFAALQNKNDKLQETFRSNASSSEYKDKYVEWPLDTHVYTTGARPYASSIQLGDNLSSANDWNSEVRDKYTAHALQSREEIHHIDPYKTSICLGDGINDWNSENRAIYLPYPITTHLKAQGLNPYETSIQLGDGGLSTDDWNSEVRDKYVAHPVQLREVAHLMNPYKATVTLGDGGGAEGWKSEQSAHFPAHTLEMITRPTAAKTNEESLSLADGAATTAAWNSESRAAYIDHTLEGVLLPPVSPADFAADSQNPIIGGIPEHDAASWKSIYADLCDDSKAGAADTLPVAGLKTSAHVDIWTPEEGGNETNQLVSEYTANYTSKHAADDADISLATLHNQSSISLGSCGEANGVSEFTASFVPPPVPAKEITYQHGPLSVNPLPSYPEYASASQWKSVYGELCDQSKSGTAVPPTGAGALTAGFSQLKQENPPMFYAWGLGGTAACSSEEKRTSEYDAQFSLANTEAAPLLPAATHTPVSKAAASSASAAVTSSPLPSYEEYASSSKWISSYKESCLHSGVKATPSATTTAGAKKEASPIYYAWNLVEDSSAAGGRGDAASRVISENRDKYVQWSTPTEQQAQSRQQPPPRKGAPYGVFLQFGAAATWCSEYDDKFRSLAQADSILQLAKSARLITEPVPESEPLPVHQQQEQPETVEEEPFSASSVELHAPPAVAPAIQPPGASRAATASSRGSASASGKGKEATEASDAYRWPGPDSKKPAAVKRPQSASAAGKENQSYQSEHSTYAWPSAVDRSRVGAAFTPRSTLRVQGSDYTPAGTDATKSPISLSPDSLEGNKVSGRRHAPRLLAAETPSKPTSLIFGVRADAVQPTRSMASYPGESAYTSPVKASVKSAATPKAAVASVRHKSPASSSKKLFATKKDTVNPIFYNRRYPPVPLGRGRWASESMRSYTWKSPAK